MAEDAPRRRRLERMPHRARTPNEQTSRAATGAPHAAALQPVHQDRHATHTLEPRLGQAFNDWQNPKGGEDVLPEWQLLHKQLMKTDISGLPAEVS